MKRLIGLAAIMGCLLLVATSAPAAEAAAPARRPAATHEMKLPAFSNSMSARATAATVHAPSVYPSVKTVEGNPGSTVACASGVLCAAAPDPTTGKYKVFYLALCNRYSLSYWSGQGAFVDDQTGSVTSYFYGQSGNILKSFRSPQPSQYYTWDAVYSIRNCS